MTIAIYAGTFDPFTLGHEDVLKRACLLFDHVIVAIAKDCNKHTLFCFDERINLANECTKQLPNVSVCGFEGLLCTFALSKQANVLIRGVRNGSDFDYECNLAGINHHLNPAIQTVFFPPHSKTQFISGSMVRELARLGGDISAFVAPCVIDALNKKFGR